MGKHVDPHIDWRTVVAENEELKKNQEFAEENKLPPVFLTR